MTGLYIPGMTTLHLPVDRFSSTPIHRQISEGLRRAILDGRLRPGRRIPSTRALAVERPAAESIVAYLHTSGLMAEVRMRPTRAGPMQARIVLSTDSGLEPKEILMRFSNDGAGIAAIERQAVRKKPGEWQADGLHLPVPGHWTIAVDVLLSDFEKATLSGEVEVKQ